MSRLRSFNPLASMSTALFTLFVSAVVVMYLVLAVRDIDTFVQTMGKSLGLGATYSLVALGFVLIFKATQVVNFAQGALAMVGALFVSFMVRDGHIPLTTLSNPIMKIGGPTWVAWFLSVLVALGFAGVLGLIIERVVIRPMVGQPLFSVAVITLGLETALRVMANDAVKAEQRAIDSPWGSRGFHIGEAFIAWSYLAAILTAAVVFTGIYFFYRSRLGVAMRAVAFDQEAAMVQGINVGQVFAIAWVLGAVLAAIGGIFATQPPIAQTGSVQMETQFIAFRSLPAVILGGLDSVQGALVGGLIVGLAEITAGQYLSGQANILGAGYPLIVPYVVMIVGLLVRPYGIFGTPEVRRV